MRSGTRPTTHAPKKGFHHKFGGTTLADIPDFNLDAGMIMQDQVYDNASEECTGYAISDLATDLFKMFFSPDFSYAANFYVTGEIPTDQGASFVGAMQGFICLGALPTVLADISASTLGSLYVAQWNNWKPLLKAQALKYTEPGILNALGNGDHFSSVLSAAYTGKLSVSCGTPWFPEWETQNGPNGEMVLPYSLNTSGVPWHNWRCKGQKTINGKPYLIVKSWQGKRIGKDGWLYMPQEVANAVFNISGTGALTIDPNAIRWISELGVLINRFPSLLSYLPKLINA